MRDDFLIFGSPAIEEEEIAEVVATLRSGWIGTGPRVARFEDEFARYVGAGHAVALSSCTAALHLSLLAAGIGAGDEVVTTPMTFCATANAIVHAGANPVFADVDPHTGNMDPDAVEAAITPRTAALLPVHLGGRPADMDRLKDIAREHGLLLVEDAAHATGAAWRDKMIGSIGDATCFSFYVTKNLVTAEGGMVTTDDAQLAARIKTYALHGLSEDAWSRFSVESFRHYQVQVPGYKCNMTDVQAALGLHQLARIDRSREHREELWEYYDTELAGLPLQRPAAVDPRAVHARHLYSVLIDSDAVGKTRDRVLDELIALRIGTGVHYVPIHLHPWYREHLGHREGDFPVSERIGERTLSLPLSAKVSKRDAEDVVEAIRRVLA